MSRTTMLAASALALGLATSVTPAMASTGGSSEPSRAQVSQGYGHDRNDRRDYRHHRHNYWRFFVVGGVIESIDRANGEIRIDPRRGPDRTLEVRDWTRIWRDGDRAGFDDLAVGDRAFVRAVKKDGDRWAVRIAALS